MINKTNIIFILCFLLSLVSVYSLGNCQLDKYEYVNSERAVFSCSCSSPLEENQNGYIVWRNTSSLLQNQSFNTGSCRTSFSNNVYILPPFGNYTGNVTFETTSLNWNNSDDIKTDTFNLTTATNINCLITLTNLSQAGFDIGDQASFKGNVKSSDTLEELINAKCELSIYDINKLVILSEPYDDKKYSTSEGEIIFLPLLNNDKNSWFENSTYIYEIHCVCLNNSDNMCYSEETGKNMGFRTCTNTGFFSTGNDLRENKSLNISLIGIALILIVIMAVFFYLMIVVNNFDLKLTFMMLGVFMIIVCLWVGHRFFDLTTSNLEGLKSNILTIYNISLISFKFLFAIYAFYIIVKVIVILTGIFKKNKEAKQEWFLNFKK